MALQPAITQETWEQQLRKRAAASEAAVQRAIARLRAENPKEFANARRSSRSKVKKKPAKPTAEIEKKRAKEREWYRLRKLRAKQEEGNRRG